jgi:ABC-type transporter Mla MlaB component
MLRITDIPEITADGSAVRTLRLDGEVAGEWVKQLRHAWRAVRLAAPHSPISVVLADVHGVDAAGRALLAEMRLDGARIIVTDAVDATVRSEIVSAISSDEPPGD